MAWNEWNKEGSVNIEPESNVSVVMILIIVVLLAFSPMMYLLGKSDGKADAYAACDIILDRQRVTNDATLKARILLDRVQREHGIVCDGGDCYKQPRQ